MRASGGTNCELAGSVVACTNARIACFAGPSFHEGSASVCAWACAPRTSKAAKATNRANTNTEGMRFIGVSTLVEPMQERAARMGHPHHPLASRLLARVSRSVPDLLCDLIQVPALRALKGRELFVGLELLEPQQLAEGQHVPVVDISRNRPGERTGERVRRRLAPFARDYGLLEWIALEVGHACHELGLDSRNIEASGSFGGNREIHLPVFVAYGRRFRAGIVEEGVSRRLVRLACQIVNLVDAVQRRLDDAPI